MFVNRQVEAKIKEAASKFPIITVTGSRQSGKSTMLKSMFQEYRYVSLEDPDIRQFAEMDPRGFLQEYDRYVILDEIQHVPELFSYLQTKVDADDITGEYILSGSHNFLLMEKISQSLAGRSALFKLTPFSLCEMKEVRILKSSVWEQMLYGGYPRIYDKSIDPMDYFPNYVATYIERDVRAIKNITNASAFMRFVKLCAARSGQILKINELARDSGISVPTVYEWLSILEQSYVIFMLRPYYQNFSKRLVKSPKLYFYDTGLLCYLLGIEDEEGLKKHDLKGNIFETMIISEYLKSCYFLGREPEAYFWRDTLQNEIDLLTEEHSRLEAYEIKLSETMKPEFTKTLNMFRELANLEENQIHCIYRGTTMKTNYGEYKNYLEL